jgi:hypothetical protein
MQEIFDVHSTVSSPSYKASATTIPPTRAIPPVAMLDMAALLLVAGVEDVWLLPDEETVVAVELTVESVALELELGTDTGVAELEIV